jgi:hypothetical protein
MLVLGDNLLITFLGWEGVGACSYLLISFWFTDEANASASQEPAGWPPAPWPDRSWRPSACF